MKLCLTTLVRSALAGFLLLLCSPFINAQSVGVSSGVGVFSFFDLQGGEHYSSQQREYKIGDHQFIKLDLINYIPDASFLKLSFNFERSSGYVKALNSMGCFCGLGCFDSFNDNVDANFTIYRMGLRLMPININIYKGVKFGVGAELSRTLRSTKKESSLQSVNSIFPQTRNDEYNPINKNGIGVVFELNFGEFILVDGIRMSPIYSANISLSDEVKTNFGTRSWRQALGVAVIWDLKPKTGLNLKSNM